MLVLSRKRMERILIGTGIRITVVKLEGSQVRLGIEAPPEVLIARSELLEDSTFRGRELRGSACVPPKG